MTTQSTQLVTMEDKVQALREKSGIVGKDSKAFWPNKLTVNREPLDKDGNTMPMGKYRIDTESGVLFLDEVDMMIVATGTQYSMFEKQGDKTVAHFTMIETGYKGEYKDTKGGVRLGRPESSKGVELTEQQKNVKFTYHILGIADVTGAKDREGNVVFKETTYLPVALSVRGKKTVLKQQELKKLRKKKESFIDFMVHLSKPFKDGEVAKLPTYDFNISRGESVTHTEEWIHSISYVQDLLENENRRLYAKHISVQRNDEDVEEGTYTDLDLE